MRRLGLGALLMLVALLVLAPAAFACSRDDNNYFDTFVDQSCLSSVNFLDFDPLGGLRLATTGSNITQAIWDTSAQFTTGSNVSASNLAAVNTLDITTNGGMNSNDPGALQLRQTSLPLTRDFVSGSNLGETTSNLAATGSNLTIAALIALVVFGFVASRAGQPLLGKLDGGLN